MITNEPKKVSNSVVVIAVMNFVFSSSSESFQILPIDKLLLIVLARHHGYNGIYPSTKTLAKELNISDTYVKDRIKALEEHNLILVERKLGCTSHYKFLFLPTDLSTVVDRSTTVDQSTTVVPTGQLQLQNRSTTVDPININKQYSLKNIERGKTALSLSVDKFGFLPSHENIDFAKKHELDLEKEIESFMQRCKYKKSQYEFKNWLQHAVDFKLKKLKIDNYLHKEHTKCSIPDRPSEVPVQILRKTNEERKSLPNAGEEFNKKIHQMYWPTESYFSMWKKVTLKVNELRSILKSLNKDKSHNEITNLMHSLSIEKIKELMPTHTIREDICNDGNPLKSFGEIMMRSTVLPSSLNLAS